MYRMRLLLSPLLVGSILATPALAARVVIIEKDGQRIHPGLDVSRIQPRHRTGSNSRAEALQEYRDAEEELILQHTPPPPAPLTKEEIEELVDAKIEERANPKPAQKPAPTAAEDPFGQVGGLGAIGGIGQTGMLTAPDSADETAP